MADTAVKDVKELREQALAKFKEADAFAKAHGIKDANDALNGTISAEDWQSFNAIMKDAQTLDTQFAEASERSGQVTDLRDRMDFYSKAVTGKGLGLREVVIQRPVSMGQRYTESDVYKELLESGALDHDGTSCQTRPVQLAANDVISTADPTSAGGLVTPQYLPGVLPLPQRPLMIRELFSQAPATSDMISYARQTAFESGADMVAQATAVDGSGTAGGVKPQSSVSWVRKTSPVETLATWMATTRQALADAGQIASLIDNQGRLMLQLLEEDQFIAGSGSSPDLEGIEHTWGVQTLDVSGATPADLNNLKSFRVARRMIKTGLARANADAIVIHPNDSEQIDLMVDSIGQFRGGNPVGNFNYDQPLWGLRRVESEAVDEGTAIVGAFKFGATVYERQGLTVYTSDSHADFFVRNLIVLLFEERLGFAMFYPAAFVQVTLAPTNLESGSEGFISGS